MGTVCSLHSAFSPPCDEVHPLQCPGHRSTILQPVISSTICLQRHLPSGLCISSGLHRETRFLNTPAQICRERPASARLNRSSGGSVCRSPKGPGHPNTLGTYFPRKSQHPWPCRPPHPCCAPGSRAQALLGGQLTPSLRGSGRIPQGLCENRCQVATTVIILRI